MEFLKSIVIKIALLCFIGLPGSTQSYIHFEEDFLSPFNSDQNYTGGFEFGGASVNVKKRINNWEFLKQWYEMMGIIGSFGIGTENSVDFDDGRSTGNFSGGLTNFTPDSLEISIPQFGDRPYSNLLYLAWSGSKSNGVNYKVTSKSVVGLIGSNIGGFFQIELHDQFRKINALGLNNSQDPLGWSNQISDGGELTFSYSLDIKRSLSSGDGWFPLKSRLDYGYTLGTLQRSANIKLLFASKCISPIIIDFQDDAISNLNAIKGSVKDYNWYYFFYVNPYYIAKNQLLSGGAMRSIHTEQERPLVWNAAVGGGVEILDRFDIKYIFRYRSKEHFGNSAVCHFWGSLFLIYSLK